MSTEVDHPPSQADIALEHVSPLAAEVQVLWRVASRVAGTAMVPKALRGRPEEVFAVLMFGKDLGLPPMVALNSLHVIEGAVGMSAELLDARVRQSGGRVEVLERSPTRCALRGTRRDGTSLEVVWTIEEARKAGLVRDGSPWTKYPRAMLHARARAELARALFPEATLGFAVDEVLEEDATAPRVDYETGEVLDVESEEVDPEDAADAEWTAQADK